MPNHMLTEIVAAPEVIDALLRPHTQEEIEKIDQDYLDTCKRYKERTGKDWPYSKDDTSEPIVDFALLVPPPDNLETGSCSGKHDPGVVCWYEWNRTYWGTKWNAYDGRIEHLDDGRVQLRFDTAWSHPYPVIEALFEKFPDATIEVKHADEDLGGGVGWYKLENGEVETVQEFKGYDDESTEFAAQLRYGMTYAELRKEWGEDEEEEA